MTENHDGKVEERFLSPSVGAEMLWEEKRPS